VRKARPWAKEHSLETGLCGLLKAPPLLDGDENRRLDAAACHNLRALF
jgi:hypothetical protein